MGAGAPYLGQLGMGPLKALGGQRPPEPEGGTSYPSAEDRSYESREARPLECWPPGAGRPAPPQADRPAQALAPPMAPPHVSPGSRVAQIAIAAIATDCERFVGGVHFPMASVKKRKNLDFATKLKAIQRVEAGEKS
ncbi:hypothetical protein HPB52_003334 [Rhipicephalus sanguineus]|uniref:Uncharacterized protein n=1 Tax=Rhipicephalus sanguineus TaxID=34632 RepID=A0A9D4QFV7_RHISA|nr:hypothetical protein HPB52_003334 [Rhipicephalus sanguineus]